MKPFIITSIVSFIIFFCSCQTNPNAPLDQKDKSEPSELTYNQDKAEAFGADQWGMKKYVMAFLKRGPNRTLDSLKSAELQTAHLKNIGRLAELGKLVVAGPFLDDGQMRGIYIFNVETIKEAEDLTNSDPAIQAGSLVMELREWYGSAALMAVNDLHKEVSKESITK